MTRLDCNYHEYYELGEMKTMLCLKPRHRELILQRINIAIDMLQDKFYRDKINDEMDLSIIMDVCADVSHWSRDGNFKDVSTAQINMLNTAFRKLDLPGIAVDKIHHQTDSTVATNQQKQRKDYADWLEAEEERIKYATAIEQSKNFNKLYKVVQR